MNKLFTKVAVAFVGMAMAIGVGVAVGQKSVTKVNAAPTNATISFGNSSGQTSLTSSTTSVNDSQSNSWAFTAKKANDVTLTNFSNGNGYAQAGNSSNKPQTISFIWTVSSDWTIKSLSLSLSGSGAAGSGTVSFTVGGTDVTPASNSYSGTTSATISNNSINADISSGGKVSIVVSNNTSGSAVKFYSLAVSYESSSGITKAEVETLISNIGTVEYTAASKAKIDSARAAADTYNDQDGCSFADLSNYSTLTAAEARYEELSLLYTTETLTVGTNGNTTWTNGERTESATVGNVTFTALCSVANDGKYYSSDNSWRFYTTDYGVKISVPTGKKITEVVITWSTGAPKTPTGFTADGSTSPIAYSANALTDVNEVIFVRNSANFLLRIAKVTYTESTKPAITITNTPSSLEIGGSGTFTYETANATSPSVTWSSSDESVLTVGSSTGAFEAKKAGTATVTANMTCTEGNASCTTSTIIVNAGLITIEQAITIASGLESGKTTSYNVTLSGYITDFNPNEKAEGSENAITISDVKKDVAGGHSLMIFGVYSNANERKYAVYNGTVRYTGKLQNYSGTYEMTGSAFVSYIDDAITFATTAYEYLDEACEAGTQAVTNEQWAYLTGLWADVDSYSKTKLQSVDSSYTYNENIANWMGRYTIIVGAGRADFMEVGISSSQMINPFTSSNNSTTTIIIVVISLTSLIAVGAFLFLKKRKEQ